MAVPAPDNLNLEARSLDALVLPPVYPWRRFWARRVDELLVLLFIFVSLSAAFIIIPGANQVISALANIEKPQEYFFGAFIYLVLIPVEGGLLATWGTTPGKRLFGLKVRKPNGEKLNFLQACIRTFWVDLFLMFNGIVPILGIALCIFQYKKLKRSGYASWDKNNQTVVYRYVREIED